MSASSFFGMSGHFYVLSLFLRRGYNVAVPVVDVGDDAILIDDGEHTTHRLQVKSGDSGRSSGDLVDVAFTLSRKQLRDDRGAPLYYMLLAWVWGRWSFILISREALYERKARRGGRVKSDDDATDKLVITVTFTRSASPRAEDALLWNESLSEHLNRWVDWPELAPGRGAPGPARDPG